MELAVAPLRPVDQVFLNACKNGKSLDFALSQGANVNVVDPENGKTGLFYCCERGDFDAVERLLNEGANIKVSSYQTDRRTMSTPFLSAILGGNVKVIALLLEKGADPYTEDMVGRNALTLACQLERPDVIKFLALNTDVNVKKKLPPFSALHYAAHRGNPDVITILAQCGADPNIVDGDGKTPRQIAERLGYKVVALYLKQLEELKIPRGTPKRKFALLVPACDAPVPPAFIRMHGQQLAIDKKLFEACLGNISLEDMAYCIDLGADLNFKDNLGHTPLFYAYHKGFLDRVDLLLKRGANLQIASIDEERLLCLAGQQGYAGIVQKLIENNVDLKSKNSVIGFEAACFKGYEDIVKILLDAGIDPRCKTDRGTTPLHAAAIGGKGTIVKMLLDRKVEVDARDNGGMTPLVFAGNQKNHEVVDLLLGAGADNSYLSDDYIETAQARIFAEIKEKRSKKEKVALPKKIIEQPEQKENIPDEKRKENVSKADKGKQNPALKKSKVKYVLKKSIPFPQEPVMTEAAREIVDVAPRQLPYANMPKKIEMPIIREPREVDKLKLDEKIKEDVSEVDKGKQKSIPKKGKMTYVPKKSLSFQQEPVVKTEIVQEPTNVVMRPVMYVDTPKEMETPTIREHSKTDKSKKTAKKSAKKAKKPSSSPFVYAQKKVVDVLAPSKSRMETLAMGEQRKKPENQESITIADDNMTITVDVPLQSRSLLLTSGDQNNPLKEIKEHSEHVMEKATDPADLFHNFSTQVEERLGSLAHAEIIKKPTAKHSATIEYTIPASINLFGSKQAIPGVFEFITRDSKMFHRMFRPAKKVKKKKDKKERFPLLMSPSSDGDSDGKGLPQ